MEALQAVFETALM